MPEAASVETESTDGDKVVLEGVWRDAGVYHILWSILRVRHFFPNVLEDGLLRKWHAELLPFIEATQDRKKIPEEYADATHVPSIEESNCHYSMLLMRNFLMLLGNPKGPPDLAGLGNDEKQKFLAEMVQDLVKSFDERFEAIFGKLSEAVLFRCVIPSPNDEIGFDSPLRCLELLERTWGQVIAVIAVDAHCMFFGVPHPLLNWLVAAELRIHAYREKLPEQYKSHEIWGSVEGVFDVLKNPTENESIQEWKDYVNRTISDMSQLLIEAKTRMPIGDVVPLILEEHAFFHGFNEHILRYREQSTRRDKAALATADKITTDEKQRLRVIWSDPKSPSQWAKEFGISLSTLKRWRKDEKIRVHEMTTKSWRIWKDDLPPSKGGA